MFYEHQVFQNPVRVQLTTTAFKQCTYLATHQEFGRVFVKGPYRTQDDAEVPVRVHAFKKRLLPDLPSIECCVLHLLVDVKFLNCQYGIRTRWTDPDGYFFVCSDLSFVDPIPIRHRSSKVWTVPVPIVDFSRMDISHVWYSKIPAETIFLQNPALAVQYVLHVLAAWVCGSGADLARRNFIIKDDSMYAVDLDVWADFTWNLSDTPPASKRTQANAQFAHFCEMNWNTHLSKILKKANETLKSGLSDLPALMYERMEKLTTLDGLLQVIDMDVREKRQKKINKN